MNYYQKTSLCIFLEVFDQLFDYLLSFDFPGIGAQHGWEMQRYCRQELNNNNDASSLEHSRVRGALTTLLGSAKHSRDTRHWRIGGKIVLVSKGQYGYLRFTMPFPQCNRFKKLLSKPTQHRGISLTAEHTLRRQRRCNLLAFWPVEWCNYLWRRRTTTRKHESWHPFRRSTAISIGQSHVPKKPISPLYQNVAGSTPILPAL